MNDADLIIVGTGLAGLVAAAEFYYGKSLDQLTTAEGAMLA